MFINNNKNIHKAHEIFKIKETEKETKDNNTFENLKQETNYKGLNIDLSVDTVRESQYISKNFQIGLSYVQIAKSTISETKEILNKMKDLHNKFSNEYHDYIDKDLISREFRSLVRDFTSVSNQLNIDVRENLFYNKNNELIFRVTSPTTENSVLIQKLDINKLNIKNLSLDDSENNSYTIDKINSTLEYITSSEKNINESHEKLSKVNMTDIMSENLLALNSNQNKESIQSLIDLTKNGMIKESNYLSLKNLKKKNIDDLLK